MAKALRVRDSAAFQIPHVRAFLERALATDKLIQDVPAAIKELESIGDRADLGVFLVGDLEKGDWRGMLFAQSSGSAFNPACVVIHFYNEGDDDDRSALIRALYRFAEECGNTRIVGIDTNDKPRAFGKLFAALGSPSYGGQVFIFDMQDSLL